MGLSEETRSSLLSKYELKADLATLAPLKLNKDLVPALTPSVIKRDEYQMRSQAQVGSCLNAFGLGMSILLKSQSLQQLNEEACSALSYFSEGMHLLADHYYCLSLARRAFTKPSFNIIGKNAAETASIDEFLFGQNFAETLKVAQACEKPGRDISRATSLLGKKTLQPTRQQVPQRRSQPSALKTHFSENRKAPARSSTANRAGASHSRSRRPLYRSRSRHRH